MEILSYFIGAGVVSWFLPLLWDKNWWSQGVSVGSNCFMGLLGKNAVSASSSWREKVEDRFDIYFGVLHPVLEISTWNTEEEGDGIGKYTWRSQASQEGPIPCMTWKNRHFVCYLRPNMVYIKSCLALVWAVNWPNPLQAASSWDHHHIHTHSTESLSRTPVPLSLYDALLHLLGLAEFPC